jgi:integrase
VSAAVQSWLADAKLGPAARWKGGTQGGTGRSFMPHVRRFEREHGSHKLPEITAPMVERFVSHGDAAATRNRALTALRLFWSWARRKGLAASDPTAGLKKERETERTRTLTDDELRALVLGFDATRYGRAVRLLALTALRRDEALAAEWTWLDSDAGLLTLPPESEKTGRARGEPRRVALSPAAVALLAEQRRAIFAERPGSPWIFATRTGERPHRDALKPTLAKLRRAGALPADATLHDVRRTVADRLLNVLAVPPWVVDHVVLGHVRPKLLRTYMPTLPLGEAREALTRWSELLDAILAGKPAVGEQSRRSDA